MLSLTHLQFCSEARSKAISWVTGGISQVPLDPPLPRSLSERPSVWLGGDAKAVFGGFYGDGAVWQEMANPAHRAADAGAASQQLAPWHGSAALALDSLQMLLALSRIRG